MTRFARAVELTEKEDSDSELIDVFAKDEEDLIEIVIDVNLVYPVRVCVTTREALDLFNTIRAAIDECKLEQFIEVNS